MEVTMEDVAGDFEFSGCGSTTTTSSASSLDDGTGMCYAWGELSPVADWANFCCSDDDGGHDLHGLIESMLCDDTLLINISISENMGLSMIINFILKETTDIVKNKNYNRFPNCFDTSVEAQIIY
ncbi:hypothetical protein OsJ_10229 [Oryza sativa Japonica Group]|uniref:Uncharacterized protein n=1 Tax=Oryza sativa subsp. japonica TaxID=39947 RepID=A3AGA9_ORYSJ|nr:hypothetical protein OsJ_10229 [Oryza sativa Japonica Group]